MLTYTQGNLLKSDAEALVNTVNTVGVMGKGIALMFREAFPENYQAYKKACTSGEVRVGHMFTTATLSMIGPKWIINFPTKKHWRDPSKLEWIEEGLDDLKCVIRENKINSIAMPALGCGNGGLDWKVVRPLIEEKLLGLDDVNLVIYEPPQSNPEIQK